MVTDLGDIQPDRSLDGADGSRQPVFDESDRVNWAAFSPPTSGSCSRNCRREAEQNTQPRRWTLTHSVGERERATRPGSAVPGNAPGGVTGRG